MVVGISSGEKNLVRNPHPPLGLHCLDGGGCASNEQCRERCDTEGYRKGGKC